MSSYPSIFATGHRYVVELFNGPVVIQEKVDGSQFSWGIIEGKLRAWSKRTELDLDGGLTDKTFALAVESVRRMESKLQPNWVYFGEFLARPKHNTLAYSRAPVGNIALFDVLLDDGNYADPTRLMAVAASLGIDVVTCFWHGPINHEQHDISGYLNEDSFLGGCKIEGVVVKNYGRSSTVQPGAPCIGKLVSPKFKERNMEKWAAEKQPRGEFVEGLIATLRTDARWEKAVQHLRDDCKLWNAPQDIPALLEEVQADILREEGEQIKEELFEHFKKDIMRGVIRGLPQWYKAKLASEQAKEQPQ